MKHIANPLVLQNIDLILEEYGLVALLEAVLKVRTDQLREWLVNDHPLNDAMAMRFKDINDFLADVIDNIEGAIKDGDAQEYLSTTP